MKSLSGILGVAFLLLAIATVGAVYQEISETTLGEQSNWKVLAGIALVAGIGSVFAHTKTRNAAQKSSSAE